MTPVSVFFEYSFVLQKQSFADALLNSPLFDTLHLESNKYAQHFISINRSLLVFLHAQRAQEITSQQHFPPPFICSCFLYATESFSTPSVLNIQKSVFEKCYHTQVKTVMHYWHRCNWLSKHQLFQYLLFLEIFLISSCRVMLFCLQWPK